MTLRATAADTAATNDGGKGKYCNLNHTLISNQFQSPHFLDINAFNTHFKCACQISLFDGI